MATTYLTRSLSSTSTSWTFSAWVKRGSNLGTTNYIISWGNSGSDATGIGFNASNTFQYYSESSPDNKHRQTSAVYRDTSAWYHLVCKCDANAITLYVNGEEPTQAWSTGSSANPLDTSTMQIGKWVTSAYYHDGSMAHVHFIDGTAYDASAFGETDATTGIWKPKTAPSVTYGTNGFFLKFENSGAFGTDSSGNSNTFTVNGTMTQNIDTPSNVFAVFNALTKNSITTLSNGNLKHVGNNSSWSSSSSTLGVSSGKWYTEFKFSNSTGTDLNIGIHSEASIYNQQNDGDNYIGKQSTSYGYFNNGNKVNNSSSTAYGASYTNGDIVGVALDMDAGTISFYKNGVSQGTAFTGLSGTYFIGLSTYKTGEANFGNGYFGTTAVSSAQNPDDGIGIFEYDVPTGYYALNTKAINAQEYD